MDNQGQAAKPFREIPTYVCHKQVKAFQIREIKSGDAPSDFTLVPTDEGLPTYNVSGAYILKHQPKPGGYLVIYGDGYISFSPAKAFEDGYTRL